MQLSEYQEWSNRNLNLCLLLCTGVDGSWWTSDTGCFIASGTHPFAMHLRVPDGARFSPVTPLDAPFVGKTLGLCAQVVVVGNCLI
jgi:hypothetical protein